MKKVLTLLLTLCLVASVVSCFAVVANAEDIQVSVGQSFEWNDQSETVETTMAWYNSKATSPDGLWKYQFYSLNKDVYSDMTVSGKDFCWKSGAGSDDYGLGMARVQNVGKTFHPGYAADAVKVFTCPSGGSIQISSTVSRQTELQSGGVSDGSTFAIYVEDRLVYPEEGGGDYLTLVSTEERDIDVIVDVKKGERVRIHIGALKDQTADGVNMANTITYKSVNDEEAGELSNKTLTYTPLENTNTIDLDALISGGNSKLPVDKDGLSVGAIIGIVVGAVAVVGIAAVVVVVLKKKKQD